MIEHMTFKEAAIVYNSMISSEDTESLSEFLRLRYIEDKRNDYLIKSFRTPEDSEELRKEREEYNKNEEYNRLSAIADAALFFSAMLLLFRKEEQKVSAELEEKYKGKRDEQDE